MTKGKEAAVGFFVLLGLLCVAYLTVKLGRMELTGANGYTIYDRFSSVMGLRPGGDIMIHGLGPEGRALSKQRRDWTAGCIAVTDAEAEDIYAMVQPGVPIFVYP